jgi:hypothetical protein
LRAINIYPPIENLIKCAKLGGFIMKMIKEKLIPIDVGLITKFMKIEEVLSKGVYTGTTHTVHKIVIKYTAPKHSL